MRNLRGRRLAAALAISILPAGLLGAAPAAAAPVAVAAGAVSSAAQVGAVSAAAQAGVRETRTGAGAGFGQARVRKELRALERAFSGRIGAYAVDTATGRAVTYRAGERFPLLSTFKAPLCAAALHRARTSEPGLMDRLVKWTTADLKPNSPTTSKHVETGLTVSRLCEAAVTESDNTAANMILKQIGGPAGLTRYFRSLKDPISRLDRYETELNDWSPKEQRDTTTPRAISRDLRLLTAGNALTAKDREQLNAWLIANKTGDARIRAGLPKNWTIGDKTGTNSDGFGGANDIAVIWPDKGAAPIIMAIYTTRRPGLAADDKTVAKTATILARGIGRL